VNQVLQFVGRQIISVMQNLYNRWRKEDIKEHFCHSNNYTGNNTSCVTCRPMFSFYGEVQALTKCIALM